MKNVTMLPVTEEVQERLTRMAGMHRMYGGPAFDIGTVVDNKHVLVLITTKDNSLSDRELIKRGDELFDSELPEDVHVYYAINTPYKKHIPTYDTRHIFRIDKGPLLATIEKGRHLERAPRLGFEANGYIYGIRIIAGSDDSRLGDQLKKWAQMSVVRDRVQYDVEEDFDLRDAVSAEKALEELFATSPMPDKVRVYKSKYSKGELGIGAKAQLIEEFTGYRPILVCLPK